MPGFLRRRGFGPVALFAALVAGMVIPVGCGSQPAADQEASGVRGETAEVTEGEATEEGPTGEMTEPEGSPSELPSAQAQPAAEEAAPRTLAAEPAAPVAAAAAVDWVGTSQKWVPIFSLESEGVYVGAAQVAGPSSQVGKVKGVAEVRLSFKDIGRIYAYVPVSTISLTKLKRVQGVSVWAIGDLQIAEL